MSANSFFHKCDTSREKDKHLYAHVKVMVNSSSSSSSKSYTMQPDGCKLSPHGVVGPSFSRQTLLRKSAILGGG